MAKKLDLNLDESILLDEKRYGLQGKKIKFPVRSRCVITNQRFINYDLGKMAPLYMQLGFLIRPLVKGRPVCLPLDGLTVRRGKYFKNSKILELRAQDGTSVLLDKFEKSLEWLRDNLMSHGIGMNQTGEEEWRITI